MRIGIFSDVHGHLNELKKTLALFQQLRVDRIICGGDLVDKGRDSDAVIDLMREQAIPCVQGNHDAKARFAWLADGTTLQDRSLTYLNKLPTSLTFEWEQVSVYICHSNPWEDSSVYVYPTRPRVLFELIAKSVEANVIVLGHTHQPMDIRVNGKAILNPGSIYGNRELDHRTCGILTLPQRLFEIYDIDTAQKLTL